MRKASQRDSNHAEIVATLRASGCRVQDLSLTGGGVPDVMVSAPNSTRNVLMEIKTAEGKLNAKQQAWHTNWYGECYVVRTPIEAMKIMGRYRE